MSCFWSNYEVSLTISEMKRVNKVENVTNTYKMAYRSYLLGEKPH